VAGSGKGKLVDAAAVIATGRRAHLMIAGKERQEWDKLLMSVASEGWPTLHLDAGTILHPDVAPGQIAPTVRLFPVTKITVFQGAVMVLLFTPNCLAE